MVEIPDKEYRKLQARLKELESAVIEHKQADEALRISETRYRRLFETAKDGILLLDADTGQITDANPFLINMLGYSHEEFLGKQLWELGLFKDIKASKTAFLELQRKGYIRYENLPFETKDGRRIDVEFVCNIYLVDHKKVIQCNIRDTTERKRMEEALQQSGERYRALFEQSPAGVFLYDKELRIVQCNERLVQIMKSSHDKIVGLDLHTLNDQSIFPSIENVFGGQSSYCEGFYKSTTGTAHLWASWHFAPLRDTQGNIVGGIGVVEDFTERKQAEEGLQKEHRRISVLYKIDRAASQSLKLNEILSDALDAAMEVLGIEAGGIFLLEPDGVTMTLRVHKGLSEEFVKNVQRIKLGEGVSGRAAAEREPVVLNVSEYPTSRLAPFIVQEGFQTVASTPLISSGKLVGALNIGTFRSYAFPKEELELLTSVGLQLGMAVQNALLYEKVQQELAERKRAEEALRESEERYRQLVEFTPDGFGINVDGKIAFMNTAGAKILGAANPEQLIGKPVMDIVHPDYREIVKERIKELSEDKTSVPFFEEKYIRLDGTNVDVEVVALRFIYHGKTAFQYVFRDITERKQAENELKESEEKHRILIENIQDGVFIIQDAKVEFANESFARICGYTMEEVIGMDFRELVAPEDMEMVANNYQRRQAGENVPREYEFHVLRKDGERATVNMNVGIINYRGRVASMGTVKDITERKLAEKALQKSEAHYRSLFDNMLNGFAFCRMLFENDQPQDFIYLDVNTAFEKLTGLKNVVGKKVTEAIPGIRESNPELFEIYGRVAMTGKPERLETYLETLGIWFSISVYSTEKGYFNAIFDNITERKRAEEALRMALKNWQNTFNAIADGVFILDPEGRIIMSNGVFESMMGINTENVIGQYCYKTVHGTSDFIEDCPFKQMKQTGMRESLEFEDKERGLWFQVTVDPVYNESGEIINAVHIIRNVTDLKKAEETRYENIQLVLANKAKSDFLAHMSHELRTPLNAIIGFSEILMMKAIGELNEKQGHYIDNVLKSGKHLLALINDILDLSKVEAGKIELVIEKISVPENIDDAVTLIKERAMKHHVVIKKDIEPQLEIEADRQRFKQILFNLLSNAVKFSKPEGGTVTITAKKEDDIARISVSDTGIGIREEDMKKLFTEFEQLDPDITRKYGGTGLGLAITKKLVDLNGGKIWVESTYGEGSTFTFLMPITAKTEGTK